MSDRARFDGCGQPLSYHPGTKLLPPRLAAPPPIQPYKPLLRYIFAKHRPSLTYSFYRHRTPRRVTHAAAITFEAQPIAQADTQPGKAVSPPKPPRGRKKPVEPSLPLRRSILRHFSPKVVDKKIQRDRGPRFVAQEPDTTVDHPPPARHHLEAHPPGKKPATESREPVIKTSEERLHHSAVPNHQLTAEPLDPLPVPRAQTSKVPKQASRTKRAAMPHIMEIPSDQPYSQAPKRSKRREAHFEQDGRRNQEKEERRVRGGGERTARSTGRRVGDDLYRQEGGYAQAAYEGRRGLHTNEPKVAGEDVVADPGERIQDWRPKTTKKGKRRHVEDPHISVPLTPPPAVHHKESRNPILLDDDPVVRTAAISPLAPRRQNDQLPSHTFPEPEGPRLPYWAESVYHALYGLTINVGNLIATFAASLLTFVLGVFHCIATGVLIVLAAVADGLTTLLRMFFNIVTCHFGSGEWNWEWRHLTHVWKWGRKSTWISDFVQHVSPGAAAERDRRTAWRNSIHEARKEEYKREQADKVNGNNGQAVEVPEMRHGRYSLRPQDMEKGMNARNHIYLV